TEIDDRTLVSLTQPRDDRIVRVQHDGDARIELRDRVADAARELIDLEVAVELVAEQVRDQYDARADPPEHARQRRLIDFEHPDVTAKLPAPIVLGEQRAGDASLQVRAGAVVYRTPASRAHDVGQHPRGRRLPVRAGDEHDSVRELARDGS